MKIKKNDKVKIIAGKDKGKTGKVLQVFPNANRASVEGLNILIKHMRPKRQNEKGQRIEFPAPINISNLLLSCPKCGQNARVGYKMMESGKEGKMKKFRICKKCQQVID
jgi:large subunit ribosomal protein L24